MKDREIINLSKSVFGVCFSLGTICLIGGLLKEDTCAVAGYLLLLLATPINVLFVLGFLIHGFVYRQHLKSCLLAIGILSINIPIAILYTVIGLQSMGA